MNKLEVKRILLKKDPSVPLQYASFIQNKKDHDYGAYRTYGYFMVENGKDIVLIVEVDGFDYRTEYDYTWVLKVRNADGTIATDGSDIEKVEHNKSKKMQFILSNCFCGDIINIYVSWEKKKQPDPAPDPNPFKNTSTPLTDEERARLFNLPKPQKPWRPNPAPPASPASKINGHFVALCLPKFIDIIWYDQNNQPISEIEVGVKGYILITCEGLNNSYISCYIDESSSVYNATRSVLVTHNQAYLPFEFQGTGTPGRTDAYCKVSSLELPDLSSMQSKGISVICPEVKTVPERDQNARPLKQPVLVGKIEKLENNWNPCKFTAIKASCNDDAPVTVFDESRMGELLLYPLVAGQLESKTIRIEVVEYRTETCTGHRKGAILTREMLKAFTPVKLLKASEKPIENLIFGSQGFNFKLRYYYLPVDTIIPLLCIWPIANFVRQEQKFEIDTCRHKHKRMLIAVYPDVQWTVKFHFEMFELPVDPPKPKKGAKPKAQKTTYWEARLIFEGAWNDSGKKITKDSNIYFGAVDFRNIETVSVVFNSNNLTGTYDWSKASKACKEHLQDYMNNYLVKRFQDLVAAVDFLFTLFDTLTYFTGRKKSLWESVFGSFFKEQFPIPEFRQNRSEKKFIYPVFDIDLMWAAVVNQTTPGVKVVGSAQGVVFGGTCVVDLFALAAQVPQTEVFLSTIRAIARYIFRVEVKFNLILSGELKFNGGLAYNSASNETDSRIRLIGEIKATIELKVYMEKKKTDIIETMQGNVGINKRTETTTDNTTVEYGVKGEGSIVFRMDIEPDENGIQGIFNVYNGLISAEIYSLLSMEKTRTTETKDYFSVGEKADIKQEAAALKANDGTTSAEGGPKNIYGNYVVMAAEDWSLFEKGKEPKVNFSELMEGILKSMENRY